MKNVIFFLLGSYVLYSSAFANSGIKFLKKAEESFQSHQYSLAIDYYKKALPDVKSKAIKAEILFKTAECYMLINDPKQAEVYFQKCIRANYGDPIALLYSAQSRMKLGNYPAALDDFKKYKLAVPSNPAGELGEKSCILAMQWLNEPTPEKVENVHQLNSKDWDYAPSYDGKKFNGIYFSSTRPGVTGEGAVDFSVGEQFADLFFSRVDNAGKWSTPVPLPAPLTSGVNDAAGMMTRKGNAMYYTKCGKQSGKDIKCQIMVSLKTGNTWGDPSSLVFNVDSFNSGHPSLNSTESFT